VQQVRKKLSRKYSVVDSAQSWLPKLPAVKWTTGTTFVELVGNPTTCVPETKVEGSVIGEVEPVNTMDTTGEVIYGVRGGIGKKNKQTIQKLEGEAKDTLSAFGLEPGFESTGWITFEQAWEVT
jgi:hypothetical protein